ncbi:MAG: response regulator transcription factor [Ruminococcus sp.]|jgi:two-component system response regulator AgrA|nr:response regulator transcription factor [Ruminococcus sp.]
MIDIYICEDSTEEREVLSRYVEAAILIREYDMKLKIATSDPEKIIEELKLSKNTGIYFLDIDLKLTKNGLTLAKEIREYDPRGFIIFVTSHSEMSFLTFRYKVEALDFILKDEPKQLQHRICECIEDVHKKYKKITKGDGKTISITRGGRKIILEYDDIMFFETSANEHKLIVHTENKSMEFFGKMKDIEEEVGDEFIRCHRAYLVNKKNIHEVYYAEKLIIMKNQTKCPISHRMIRQVKSKYQ